MNSIVQFIVDRPNQFIDRNQRRASRRNGFERFLNGQAHARGRLQHGLNSPTSEVVHDCRMPGCVMERGRQLLLLWKGGAPLQKAPPKSGPAPGVRGAWQWADRKTHPPARGSIRHPIILQSVATSHHLLETYRNSTL